MRILKHLLLPLLLILSMVGFDRARPVDAGFPAPREEGIPLQKYRSGGAKVVQPGRVPGPNLIARGTGKRIPSWSSSSICCCRYC